MQLGYIGLGKMGKNMVLLLREKNYDVIAYNRTPKSDQELPKKRVKTVGSTKELVRNLKPPRLLWLMVSHQGVDAVLKELVPRLKPGDTIIDGGNSPFKESIRRAKNLANKKINFLDVGVSGGPKGARDGACMMIGGKKPVFKKYEKLFKDLTVKGGYGYMGQAGAGHFVKMVHNGIEYGMMQAIAEGFDIMRHNKIFDLDLVQVADVYNHGSVITSRLIGWLKNGLEKYGIEMKKISGSASHTGEGAWTVQYAKKIKIPVRIIEGSFKVRQESQKKPSYQGKIISTLRNQFGQHEVNKK